MGRAARRVTDGLGAQARAERMARGLGLRELAAEVGMSPSSLSEFETGKSVPGPTRLGALAEVLGLTIETAPDATSPTFEHWRSFEPVQLDAVHQAALEIFVERGYHGATVRMIADRGGMSVAGFYHHVKSKEDLIVQLLEFTMGELIARCTAADAEAGTPRERLSNLVECLVLFHIHRQPWAFFASSEARSLDEERREWLLESRRTVRRMVQDAVASTRGEHSSPVADDSIARAIANMCVGVAEWYRVAVGLSPDALASDYVTLANAMVLDPAS